MYFNSNSMSFCQLILYSIYSHEFYFMSALNERLNSIKQFFLDKTFDLLSLQFILKCPKMLFKGHIKKYDVRNLLLQFSD